MNFDRRREITPIFAASPLGSDSVSRGSIISREQEVYRPAKVSVALARKVFKSLGVEKGDQAARIAGQSIHL